MVVTLAPNSFPPHSLSAAGKTAASTNKALKNVRIPCPLGMLQAADILKDGLLVTGAAGTVSTTAVDIGGSWDDSAAVASKFTADTTDIASAGAADILLMPAVEAALDKFIVGFLASRGVPAGLSVSLSTAGIGGTGTWQYLSKLGVWTDFPKVIDMSTGLTAGTSTYPVCWQIPDDFVPMVETEISATAYYYVAFKVATVYSTNPVGTQVLGKCVIGTKIAGGWVAPTSGLVTHFTYLGGTAGATNNDIILQIINWTKQTRGLVTLTGNPIGGRFALSTQVFVDAGDEISVHPVQCDGTTEIVNFVYAALDIQP